MRHQKQSWRTIVTQTLAPTPDARARLLITGNKANTTMKQPMLNMKVRRTPARPTIRAKHKPWKTPFSMPKRPRTRPMRAGENPRPPCLIGVEKKRGWSAPNAMSRTASAP
jgi:hypothetical protein